MILRGRGIAVGCAEGRPVTGDRLRMFPEKITLATSSSHIATDGQSASSSWCRAPFRAIEQILIFFLEQLPSLF
jgi:hypothetical protein